MEEEKVIMMGMKHTNNLMAFYIPMDKLYIPITCSTQIEASGCYYLKNDIVGDILITAPNVTLNLNQKKIIMPGTRTTCIAIMKVKNVIIKNGILIGPKDTKTYKENEASFGIFIRKSSHITCENITFSHMKTATLVVLSSNIYISNSNITRCFSGIVVHDVDNMFISHIQIYNLYTGSHHCIDIANSANSSISNVSIYDNVAFRTHIRLVSCKMMMIEKCSIYDNKFTNSVNKSTICGTLSNVSCIHASLCSNFSIENCTMTNQSIENGSICCILIEYATDAHINHTKINNISSSCKGDAYGIVANICDHVDISHVSISHIDSDRWVRGCTIFGSDKGTEVACLEHVHVFDCKSNDICQGFYIRDIIDINVTCCKSMDNSATARSASPFINKPTCGMYIQSPNILNITKSIFNRNSNHYAPAGGLCIDMSHDFQISANIHVSFCSFSGNSSIHNTSYGMKVFSNNCDNNAYSTLIEHNNLSHNGNYGIYVSNIGYIIVKECICIEHKDTGIYIDNTSNNISCLSCLSSKNDIGIDFSNINCGLLLENKCLLNNEGIIGDSGGHITSINNIITDV